MKIISTSLDQTREAAAEFLRDIKPKTDGATLVCLSGDLGAGKTTFTQSLASALGVSETVTSPTFVIEKIYQLPNDKQFRYLIHIDAYRLEKGQELEILGWSRILLNSENLIVLEWPERVEDVLPNDRINITLEFINETTHTIEW